MSNLTKKTLAAALKKRMAYTPIDKITVKELVTDCGLNRQTFYYHFQDMYQLLGWIYKSETLESIAHFKSYNTWQQGFLKVFQYVEENKSFCLSTFSSLGRDHLEQFLNEVTKKLLLDVIEELSSNLNISKEYKEFIATFYCYGFVGLMLEWLKSDAKENPERILSKLSQLIDGDIKKAITQYDLNSKSF